VSKGLFGRNLTTITTKPISPKRVSVDFGRDLDSYKNILGPNLSRNISSVESESLLWNRLVGTEPF